MSYILDALRKADAQRERDPARGIHAQPLPGSANDPEGRRGWRIAAFAAGIAALAVVGWGGWMLLRDPGAGTGTIAATAPPETVARVNPTPVAPSQPAPVMETPVQPPATTAPVTVPPPMRARDARQSSLPMMRGGPQPPAGEAPAPSGAPVAVAPVPAISAPLPIAPPVSSPPAVALPVPPAPTPAAVVTGLPPDAPKLAISGGVYSRNPAQRMLIVNGQVFNEGSEIAPGVKLEAVQARTAVLGFRGARYTVPY